MVFILCFNAETDHIKKKKDSSRGVMLDVSVILGLPFDGGFANRSSLEENISKFKSKETNRMIIF